MSGDPAALADELRIEMMTHHYTPRYNVPPGAPLPIVVDRPGEDGALVRRMETARWGLVPGWAKDEKIGFRAFNARSETAAEKPMFRKAFAERRCVVPVTGYYEWQKVGDDKQPWLMHAAKAPALYMLGLFEFRKRGEDERETMDPSVQDGWLVSTTILTTEAHGHLAEVHDRMPVMVDAAGVGQWTDGSLSGKEAQGVLFDRIERMDVDAVARYRVGKAVGNVRNQGAELMEPVEE
ncbi:SOS response-associated peptidase [Brevibacterium litoralis]|uniref:SOS response-associated peptidase n=1 Tax=Brevibacterium litoralis TaxID=3138935 RepID=UPI003D9A3204